MPKLLFGKSPTDKPRVIVVVSFEKYNPPLRMQSKGQRAGVAVMTWVRLQCSWIDHPDLLDSPDAMNLWPRLLAVAGSQTTPGTLRMSVQQLARRVHLSHDLVETGLRDLWKCGLIRYSHKGANVAATTKEPRADHGPRGDVEDVGDIPDVDARAHGVPTTTEDEPYANDPSAAKLRGEASLKTAAHRRGLKIA